MQDKQLLIHADPDTAARKREDAVKMGAKLPTNFPKPDLTRVARLMVGMDRRKPMNYLSLARLTIAMLTKR